MNQQPFYHRATVLFTATTEITNSELETMLGNMARAHYPEIIPSSIVVEEIDAEPGDPQDLM